jgi:RNA polymerase sigma-32 factor
MAKSSKKQIVEPSEPVDETETDDELEPTPESDGVGPSAYDAQSLPILPDGVDGAGLSTAVVPVTTLQHYLAEVRRYPFLTKEEELRLFHEHQTQGNREAAVKLILANLRVSVAIAYEYLHTGADHMDLIQEGNVGLMQAIKKFDPTKNVRFHAYAAWWARAYILRYLLNTYRLVKVGTTQDQRRLFYNLRKEKAKLEREGFAPDTKLLADRLNVRERDVIEMDQRLGSWELSLDQPLSDDSDGTLLDVLPSQEQGVDERLGKLQLLDLFREKLASFTKTLGEREEDILRNRVLSETPVTLEDLGQKYGITKERTRQLEARMIKRLREYLQKEVKDFDQLRS